MINLIGISGKIKGGKDTAAKMLQYYYSTTKIEGLTYNEIDLKLKETGIDINTISEYKIKKFATKLKQTAAIILGVSVEKFEDQEFKESILGDEWKYLVLDFMGKMTKGMYPYKTKGMTIRKFLQGLSNLREEIHENIWVNALFSEYTGNEKWLITDARYINEFETIKKHNGILIKIENPNLDLSNPIYNHKSETEMDKYDKWSHVIINDGTLEDLYNKIKNLNL